MADYEASDLATLAAAGLFGDRSVRIAVVNVFREANDKDAVDYLVNAHIPSQASIDEALEALQEDVDNADDGLVSGADTGALEVLFTAALVNGRELRLTLLNLFREAQGLDAKPYYVNNYQPTYDTFAAALEAVGSA